MKTLIAVPCMDMVAAPFAQSLATLRKEGDVAVSFLMNSLVYDSRNKLAAQALQTGSDYVLWLDSDMTFPVDTIARLKASLDAGADIASGIYFRRSYPYTPVLFKSLDFDNKASEGYDDYPTDGKPFEIAGCGFGCVLMKTDVIRNVATEFGAPFTPYNGAGEDLSFCWRALQTGAKIVCDPAVKCGHYGHLIINEQFYQQTRAFGGARAAD